MLTGKRIADSIASVAVVLMALGVIFVSSAGARLNAEYDLARLYSYPEFRQILFFVLAVIVLYAVSRCPLDMLKLRSRSIIGYLKWPGLYAMILSIALLIIVLKFGPLINQARRWLQIPLGPITLSFQPSELAKWSLLLFLAGILTGPGVEIKRFWKWFVPVCVIIACVIGLIIIEDFGTALFVAALAFALLLVGGIKLWHLLAPLVPLAAGLYLALINSPARINRLKAFFFPDETTASTAGYQSSQSLIAIGTGSLTGKGLGAGISKYGHLPEDTTDFIFAIIAEELGFFGAFTVIALFVVFVILGLAVVRRCTEPFGRLLAFAVTLTIGAQAAINICVVTNLLPTKGIALPFISAGGTGLLLTAAAVGILVNIARNIDEKII